MGMTQIFQHIHLSPVVVQIPDFIFDFLEDHLFVQIAVDGQKDLSAVSFTDFSNDPVGIRKLSQPVHPLSDAGRSGVLSAVPAVSPGGSDIPDLLGCLYSYQLTRTSA